MSAVSNKRRYIVLSKDGVKKIITEKELEHIDFQNILYSDVKVNFYEFLPEGIYEFNSSKVKVDKEGNITIGRKTITKDELSNNVR